MAFAHGREVKDEIVVILSAFNGIVQIPTDVNEWACQEGNTIGVKCIRFDAHVALTDGHAVDLHFHLPPNYPSEPVAISIADTSEHKVENKSGNKNNLPAVRLALEKIRHEINQLAEEKASKNEVSLFDIIERVKEIGPAAFQTASAGLRSASAKKYLATANKTSTDSSLKSAKGSDSSRFLGEAALRQTPTKTKTEIQIEKDLLKKTGLKALLRQLSTFVSKNAINLGQWDMMVKCILMEPNTIFSNLAMKNELDATVAALQAAFQVEIPPSAPPPLIRQNSVNFPVKIRQELTNLWKLLETSASDQTISRLQLLYLKKIGLQSLHPETNECSKEEETEEKEWLKTDGEVKDQDWIKVDEVQHEFLEQEIRDLRSLFGTDFTEVPLTFEEEQESVIFEDDKQDVSVVRLAVWADCDDGNGRFFCEVTFRIPVAYPIKAPKITVTDTVRVTTADAAVVGLYCQGTAEDIAFKNLQNKSGVQNTVTKKPKYQRVMFDCMVVVSEFMAVLSTNAEAEAHNKLTHSLPYIPINNDLTNIVKQSSTGVQLGSVTVSELEKKLRRNLEKSVTSSNLIVIHVENIMSPTLLKRMRSTLIEINGGGSGDNAGDAKDGEGKDLYAPIMTFHGTGRANANSISESGFLAPWDIKNNGEFLRSSHGSRFGDGIYMSPSIDKAIRYAESSGGQHQILVSLVILGKALSLKEYEETEKKKA